jgi:hypothetical protein
VIDGREWEWGLEPFGMTDIDIVIEIGIRTWLTVTIIRL